MNTHEQSSLLEYSLFRRNSFNRMYHIRLGCFKTYRDLASFTQYILWFACTFGIGIPLRTFMHISESSDLYKYVVTTSNNCKDRKHYIIRDIKYRMVIPFITGDYVSLKSMSGLCVNPCVTILDLYLTTSLYSFYFWINTHLNLTPKILGCICITSVNIFLFLNKLSSTSIASFHLFQIECLLHFVIVPPQNFKFWNVIKIY
jgi:hypothetical protein